VWTSTNLGDGEASDFEKWVAEEFDGTRAKFVEVVVTLPDRDEDGEPVPDTGGRDDLLFYVHDEDISKFAVPRLEYGIRWWEDALANFGEEIYPSDALKKYPNTWEPGYLTPAKRCVLDHHMAETEIDCDDKTVEV